MIIKRLHLGGPQFLLAAGVIALALIVAFVQIGGRPAERWLRDRLAYAATPRVRLWQPQVDLVPPPPAGAWASQPVRVTWARSDTAEQRAGSIGLPPAHAS